MFILFRIISKIALITCGMFIGDLCNHGFEWVTFIGVIVSLITHYLYLYEGRKLLRARRSFKIHQLSLGDPKPNDMPDEVWNKVQALLQVCEDNNNDDAGEEHNE